MTRPQAHLLLLLWGLLLVVGMVACAVGRAR